MSIFPSKKILVSAWMLRPGTVLLTAAALLTAAGCRPTAGSAVKDFFNQNLMGGDFGLEDKELALTLDDGPGAGTEKIVAYLKKKRIPATFFMVGKQAKLAEHAAIINEIASDPLFLIANHSMNHGAALTKSANFAIKEIRDADAILYPKMRKGQLLFMRPPYGSLIGSESRIQSINAAADATGGKLSKYIGPVFWDIGGDMAKGYTADWACWSKKVSVEKCRAGYLKEIGDRGRGIILTHDVHAQTAEMLVGEGGLLDQLLSDGYRFVALDKLGANKLRDKFGGSTADTSNEAAGGSTSEPDDSTAMQPDSSTVPTSGSSSSNISTSTGTDGSISVIIADVIQQVVDDGASEGMNGDDSTPATKPATPSDPNSKDSERQFDSFDYKEISGGFRIEASAEGIVAIGLKVRGRDAIIKNGANATFEVTDLADGSYEMLIAAFETGKKDPVIRKSMLQRIGDPAGNNSDGGDGGNIKVIDDIAASFGIPEPSSKGQRLSLWSTYYYLPTANEAPGGEAVLDMGGKTIAHLSSKDKARLTMEGSLAVNRGAEIETLNYAGKKGGSVRFKRADGPYGDGVPGYSLVPYRTIAVDKNSKTMPYGTVIYVPAARGVTVSLPGGKQVVHDGYFLAGDTGGAIKGNHIDTFIGPAEKDQGDFTHVKSSAGGTFEAFVISDPEIKKKLQALH